MWERGKARYKPSKQVLEKWEQTVSELEKYYQGLPLPSYPVQISACETITDCKKFVETHLRMSRANLGNYYFGPYVIRLQKLKEVLEQLNKKAI